MKILSLFTEDKLVASYFQCCNPSCLLNIEANLSLNSISISFHAVTQPLTHPTICPPKYLTSQQISQSIFNLNFNQIFYQISVKFPLDPPRPLICPTLTPFWFWSLLTQVDPHLDLLDPNYPQMTQTSIS